MLRLCKQGEYHILIDNMHLSLHNIIYFTTLHLTFIYIQYLLISLEIFLYKNLLFFLLRFFYFIFNFTSHIVSFDWGCLFAGVVRLW